jgi:hypothetical protein
MARPHPMRYNLNTILNRRVDPESKGPRKILAINSSHFWE